MPIAADALWQARCRKVLGCSRGGVRRQSQQGGDHRQQLSHGARLSGPNRRCSRLHRASKQPSRFPLASRGRRFEPSGFLSLAGVVAGTPLQGRDGPDRRLPGPGTSKNRIHGVPGIILPPAAIQARFPWHQTRRRARRNRQARGSRRCPGGGDQRLSRGADEGQAGRESSHVASCHRQPEPASTHNHTQSQR